METAPPEALISAVEPPSPSHLGHSGGSPVLPAVKPPKTGHATTGAASEGELRVVPAKKCKHRNYDVSLLMETAPPEALIPAVEPPTPSHQGSSSGSSVLPAVKSPKPGM
ncbi:uncharacterized protein LOC142803517 [Rhipicephalus microplus]|uniref:uncharacterized protein LOC142803517 n=1 Tax=Rhipicephalus microplus TaxID=6941 RepID=UPI003F6C60DB